jgi:hypothetical protein
MKKINPSVYDALLITIGNMVDETSISIVLTALTEVCAEREIVGTPEGNAHIEVAHKLLKLAKSKKVVEIS